MDTNDAIQEQSKLTAYALDELDPTERADVDARLADDAEARRFVQQVRHTADLLRQQFHGAPEPQGLSTDQRLKIDDELDRQSRRHDPPRAGRLRVRTWMWSGLGMAAAACIMAALLLPSLSNARRSARSMRMAQENLPRTANEAVRSGTRLSARTDRNQITGPVGKSSAPNTSLPHPALGYTSQDKKSRIALGKRPNVGDRPTEVDEQSGLVRLLSALPATAGDSVAKEEGHLPGRYNRQFHTEAYDRITDNPFLGVVDNPLSTFSIDVDTASYANVRRFIVQQLQMPPKDAVRIEEMINYFTYDDTRSTTGPAVDQDDQPEDPPFAVNVEIAAAPWAPQHRLAKIGLNGYEDADDQRPAANLVFLLDVSGSMAPANKLPLLKRAMRMLIDKLTENDRVAIVVYAGASGLVLDSTAAAQKQVIVASLDRLKSGGSTNGAAGIELAYQIAAKHFIDGGINRIVLATDGDFNVGVTDRGALTRLIEEKAKTGVYLTVLGFGMGNLKDATMEELSNKGNGNYAYIDSIQEARKVLVEQMGRTMVTIAKDVKVQIEFNPTQVRAYRLIGYENRLLAKKDFNDDTKDAGDVGAGHTVTALYEIIPIGGTVPGPAAVGGVLQEQIKALQKQIKEIQDFMAQTELTTETTGQMQKEVAMLQDKIVQLRRQTTAAPSVDPLKYQRPSKPTAAAQSDELFSLKIRYKDPDAPKQQGTSRLITVAAKDAGQDQASANFRFASAVASFGMILRDSPYKGTSTFELVLDLAASGITESNDPHGYRDQFVTLVEQAREIVSE